MSGVRYNRYNYMRVRRTKDEIAAGVSLEEKREGAAPEKIRKPRKTLRQIGRELIKQEEVASPSPVDRSFEKEKPRAKDIEIIRETRVISGKDEQSLRELLDEEMANGRWEWKELKLDSSFRLDVLKEHGKTGWKFAFIFERQDEDSSVFLHKRITP